MTILYVIFDRNPIFVHSAIVQADGSPLIDDNYRSSSTAYLGRSQTPIVKCLEKRFAQFQGDIDPLRLEPLQVVKYGPNEQVDKFTSRIENDRFSSFLV